MSNKGNQKQNPQLKLGPQKHQASSAETAHRVRPGKETDKHTLIHKEEKAKTKVRLIRLRKMIETGGKRGRGKHDQTDEEGEEAEQEEWNQVITLSERGCV